MFPSMIIHRYSRLEFQPVRSNETQSKKKHKKTHTHIASIFFRWKEKRKETSEKPTESCVS